MLLFTMGCDSDDTITGGAIIPEPELVGCEGTTFYDWSDFEFSTSLDAGATTWLGFEMDETTLFSINLNQPGFHCALFEACDGELGSPPPLYSFMSNGNGQDVGIVTEGMYYLEITNTEKYVNSSKENAIQVSAPPSSEVSNSTLSQSYVSAASQPTNSGSGMTTPPVIVESSSQLIVNNNIKLIKNIINLFITSS